MLLVLSNYSYYCAAVVVFICPCTVIAHYYSNVYSRVSVYVHNVQGFHPHLALLLSMCMDHNVNSLSFLTSTGQWTKARLVSFCCCLFYNIYPNSSEREPMLVQVKGVAYRGRIMLKVDMTLGSSTAVPREPLGALDKEKSMVCSFMSCVPALVLRTALWGEPYT